MNQEQDFAVERVDSILVYRLQRDSKRNAINRAMFDGLAAAAEEFARDPELRVMLIEAEGKFFSSGFEIADLSPAGPGEGPTGFRRRYRSVARHDLFDFLESIEKPIVVAHQGPCFGVGLEMSLSCDFRLASTAATYALPEMQTGLIAGSGGTSRLVRTIGVHWARWLIMASETIDANEAKAAGLLHRVFPPEALKEETMAFCRKLAGYPPEVMGSAKLAIELVQDLGREQGRNVERLINSSLSDRDEQNMLIRMLRERFVKKP